MLRCKKCGQPIKWIQRKSRWVAYNIIDGKLHLNNCVPNDYEAKLEEEKRLVKELEQR